MADFFAELIGECPAIRAVRDQARRLVAGGQSEPPLRSVLIEGPTGSGKSLLAWLIHRSGPRVDHPFVTINCAGAPAELLEADLFGFARGGFCDGRGRWGGIEAAHRGTVVLDGIEHLPGSVQVRLERVLKTQRVLRLGETREREADVLFISTARVSMSIESKQGRFRGTLYARLADATFTMPPLGLRDGDVVLLAERFLERASRAAGIPVKRLARDAQERLRHPPSYVWMDARILADLMGRVAQLTTEPTVTAPMLTAAGVPEDRTADGSPATPHGRRSRGI